jgi:hypothetical protein
MFTQPPNSSCMKIEMISGYWEIYERLGYKSEQDYRDDLYKQAMKAPDMFLAGHLKDSINDELFEIAAYLQKRMAAPDYDPRKESHPHYSTP